MFPEQQFLPGGGCGSTKSRFGGVRGRYKKEQNKMGQRQNWGGEEKAGKWDGR